MAPTPIIAQLKSVPNYVMTKVAADGLHCTEKMVIAGCLQPVVSWRKLKIMKFNYIRKVIDDFNIPKGEDELLIFS